MPHDFLANAGGFVVHALALMILVFVPLILGSRLINALQDARLPWTPYIEVASLVVGLAGGALLLAYNVEPSAIDSGAIFRPGGPWDLTFVEFLGSWGNPFFYAVAPVLPWPVWQGPGAGSGLLFLLLAAACVLSPMIRFGSQRAVANGLRNLLILLWGVYAAAYVVCLSFWLLNKLNFWAFLVLLAVIQLARHRAEHVVLRLK